MLRALLRVLPVILLLTAACNNGDYSADPQGTLPVTPAMVIHASDCESPHKLPVSCYLDDQEFVGDSLTSRATLDSIGGELVFRLFAQQGSFKIRLNVRRYDTLRQYQFYNGSPEPLASVYEDSAHVYSNLNAGEGVVNITRADDTLEGTFYFKVADTTRTHRVTHNVCGGYFRNAR